MTARQRLILAATFLIVATGAVIIAGVRGAGAVRPQSVDNPAVASAAQGAEEGTQAAAAQIKPREATGQTADEAVAAHESATEGPLQPIPFNHRFHSQELAMQCEYCHGGTEISPIAVLPAVELCMGCHRIVGANLEPIQRLRGYWDSGQPVPWERVYKVPDFVQFPHEAHIRSQVDCEECHGKVEEMDRVYKSASLKMGWCLECHMQPGEETDVATDRLLVEQFPPPETPDERQPIGLYPRRLDQRYAARRGPIDCFVCHY
jgi:hypothetical protein